MNMKLTLSTFLLIIVIVFFSVFIANLSNLIAIHVENTITDREDETVEYERPDARSSPKALTDDPQHLMWFIQISDIHISTFRAPTRIDELRDFCKEAIQAIHPSVVLASGDLTDAKTADGVGSSQQIKEWEIYQRILKETGMANKTVWLDIRGNHDNFNIPDEKSPLNYYRSFTVQGARNPHSYIHITDVNGDRYGFLGIDACLSPGPKRPFNFVGMLSTNETDHIRKLINFAKNSGVDYTITFGHYPTSCILSQSHGLLRRMILEAPGGWIYLCGHFHMLGGLVPNMYTLQQTGLLELELADWKENRMFRIAAMDHGLFSFIDVKYDDWPVILVTNPKHALYVVPGKESLKLSARSTHIRMLVFSVSPIEVVQVRIGNKNNWITANRVPNHPALYVAAWNPSLFSKGVHSLEVRARDSMTREKGLNHQFSLDGSRLSFNYLPRIALMSNISMLFQTLFGLSVCLAVVPLCVFRVLHYLVTRGRVARLEIRDRTHRLWTRQLWILSATDRTFYPLVIYPLYLLIGPWVIGEVIDGHVGAVFAWGLIVNKSFLPGAFTYTYGMLHMGTFQLPLILILAHDIERRFRQVDENEILSKRCWHHLPFFLLICFQCSGAIIFWLAYGTLAFFLGPLRTWSIILALVLWHLTNNLPKTAFRGVKPIWGSSPAPDHGFTD